VEKITAAALQALPEHSLVFLAHSGPADQPAVLRRREWFKGVPGLPAEGNLDVNMKIKG
jgi:hypothetical protein